PVPGRGGPPTAREWQEPRACSAVTEGPAYGTACDGPAGPWTGPETRPPAARGSGVCLGLRRTSRGHPDGGPDRRRPSGQPPRWPNQDQPLFGPPPFCVPPTVCDPPGTGNRIFGRAAARRAEDDERTTGESF